MSDFYSIVAICNDGITTCTVQLSPKGKKYVVKCPPDKVFGSLAILFRKEADSRRRRLDLLERKQEMVLNKLLRSYTN